MVVIVVKVLLNVLNVLILIIFLTEFVILTAQKTTMNPHKEIKYVNHAMIDAHNVQAIL